MKDDGVIQYPHQRYRFGDAPIVRVYCYTAGSRNEVEAVRIMHLHIKPVRTEQRLIKKQEVSKSHFNIQGFRVSTV